MKESQRPEIREFYAELGKAVREARLVKGWSLQELADAVDVSRGTIINLENGRFRVSFYQYVLIADALDLSSPIEYKHTKYRGIHTERIIRQKVRELRTALDYLEASLVD